MTIDLDACLLELFRRNVVPPDTLALFAVGSIARGWANVSSDYDFYLVSRAPYRTDQTQTTGVPLSPPTIASISFAHTDRSWEISYWVDNQVDQILEKVSWPAFEGGVTGLKVMVDTEEMFLERVTTALPLLGADWVARRTADVTDSAYRAFITTRSLADADNKVEDAVGMLASGDLPSAVLATRIAFEHVVNALLDSAGHYGSRNPKWRARRVQEANLPALPFDQYWAIETMAGLDAADPADWINNTLARCKQLSYEVEIG